MKKTLLSAISFMAMNLLQIPVAFAADFPVTIKSCERDVTFTKAPSRAVSNDVNITEMMLALGLQDRMVGYTGVSSRENLSPALVKNLSGLVQLATHYPTQEILLNADADFYFAGWNYGLKVGGEITPQSLEKFGIQTYELSESCIHVMQRTQVSIEDVYNDLRNLGKIFGVSERAETLIADYKQQINNALAAVTRSKTPTRVFIYDSGEDKPFTAAKYAMPTAMIEAAGGRNIMDDVEKSWATVGWEVVVERNPQLVVIINYGDVTAEQKITFMKNNPAFKAMDAVKNNQFMVLEYDEATPGPRNITAIQKLIKALNE